MVVNFAFAENTVLSCSFFLLFFLIINFYFLTSPVITQFFNLIAELTISIGITTKEAKTKLEHIQ